MSSLPEIPAVSVALLRGDRVLLVERGRAPSQGLYAFPGGKVEPGETLEEAARRELAEETALEGAAYRPVRTLFIEGENNGHIPPYRLTVFAARYISGEAIAGDDAAKAEFYSLAQMRTLPLADSVLDVAQDLFAANSLPSHILPCEKTS
ncbi:NUDIX hydrolase [Aquamicrobium segne]|uniref:NUDIX hydrolase n=1 Tax=Aquamicrobium segne TaxID=469547 RepID=A0ABW0GVN7_9HYPH